MTFSWRNALRSSFGHETHWRSATEFLPLGCPDRHKAKFFRDPRAAWSIRAEARCLSSWVHHPISWVKPKSQTSYSVFMEETKVVDSQTLFQNTMDTGMTRVQIVWLPPCLGSPAQPRNLPARCWHFARPNPSANHLPRGWHQHGVNHDKHLRTFKNTVWYCMNQKPSTNKSSPHFHPRFPLMSSCGVIHPALSPSGPTAVPKRRETLKYW